MNAKKAAGPAPARFVPGEVDALPGEIEINVGRPTVTITVANTGDRPIQVGSHYHFYETNDALEFDRQAAWGFRLDIASGTAVRFEPGQRREVQLVAYAGDRQVYGFAGRVMGALDGKKPGKGAASTKKAPKSAPKKVEKVAKSAKPAAGKIAKVAKVTAATALAPAKAGAKAASKSVKPTKPVGKAAARREKKA